MPDIKESDRGRARNPSGRLSGDAGEREVGEPGTRDSAATELDQRWWLATAAKIFSRMPGAPGAGGGSTPQQNEGLADKLMKIFGPLGVNSHQLGAVFGVPSGRKDDLQERVAAALARIAAPALNAWAASVESQAAEEITGPDAMAVAGPTAPPVALKKRPPTGYYPTETKCIHSPIFSHSGRLSCVTNHRLTTFHNFVQSPWMEGHLDELQRRANVQEPLWTMRYWHAVRIATMPDEKTNIDDDYYSLPDREQWGGLPSEKTIGEAIHEYLQEAYLKFRSENDIVSEIDRRVHFFGAAQKGVRPQPRPLWDVLPGLDRFGALDALAFSLGSPSWHVRPDIVDLGARVIFEIKPIRSVHKGVLQLWRYLSNFRLAKVFDDIIHRDEQPGDERPPYELFPGYFPAELLKAFPLYPLLRKKGLGKKYENYWAEPLVLSTLPGLVFYRLQEGKPQDPGRIPSIIAAYAKALLAIAAVVVVAYVLITIAPAVLSLAIAMVAALIAKGVELIISPGLPRRPLPTPVESIPYLREALEKESPKLADSASRLIAGIKPRAYGR